MNADAILLAEDNPRDRDFLRGLFPDCTIREAPDGETALAQLASWEGEPRVITDLQMPGMGGVELARQIWEGHPAARIVFWSQYSDEIYLRSISRMIPSETVYGYVLKDNAGENIRRAIEAVFDECQCWIDPAVRPVQARLNRTDTSVTDAEFEVLLDIALGLTDNAIARRRFLSRRGVQSRLRSMYSKLEVDHLDGLPSPATETLNLRTRAIAVALSRGLLNTHELEKAEQALRQWLAQENDPT